jgi:hypothetical protein
LHQLKCTQIRRPLETHPAAVALALPAASGEVGVQFILPDGVGAAITLRIIYGRSRPKLDIRLGV